MSAVGHEVPEHEHAAPLGARDAALLPAPTRREELARLQRQIGNRSFARLIQRQEVAEATKGIAQAAWEADEVRVKLVEEAKAAALVALAESDSGADLLAKTVYSSRRSYRVAHALVKAAEAEGRSAAQIDAMFAKLGFTGLMLPSNVKAFVADGNATAEKFVAASGALARAKVLLELCNKHLTKVGVPKFRDTYTGAPSAEFDSENWKLGFPDRLANLGAGDMGRVIGTIYHEMRHAEQAWLKARLLSTSQTDAAIAKAVEIPEDIAREARSKGAPSGNAEQLKRIASYYGSSRLTLVQDPSTSAADADYFARPTEHEGHLLTNWINRFGGR